MEANLIALIAGVPGVGKSSVTRLLAESHRGRVEHVSFGALLFETVAARMPAGFSYSTFRAQAGQLVSATDLETAFTRITSHPHFTDREKWLLVDSHAVSREVTGWHAHPDTIERLREYNYDGIALLDAPAGVVLQRTRGKPEGRGARTERDVAVLASVQQATCVYYAGVLGCPLWVIDAEPPLAQVVNTAASLLGLPVVSS
jgi:adenylate kinase